MNNLFLDDLIFGINKEKFLSEYWSIKPLYIEGGAKKCISVFDWKSLNNALSEHWLSYPRTRIIKSGVLVDPESYVIRRPVVNNRPHSSRLNLSAVNENLEDGASLIFDAIDEVHYPLRMLCNNLSADVQCQVSANAYMAFGDKAGFNKHWDDHEVMIIQIDGEKSWKVFGPSRNFPLREDIQGNLNESTELIWEGILSPGDFLYIPRGFWHEVTPTGKRTLHLTFGARPSIGYDFIEWFLQQSLVNENMRKNIPIFSKSEEITAYAEDIITFFKNSLNKDKIFNFIKLKSAQITPYPRFSLPYSIESNTINDNTQLRFVGISSYKVDSHSDQESIVIDSLDKQWQFDSTIEKTIDYITKKNNFTLDSIKKIGELNHEDSQELLHELLQKGFIEIIETNN